MKKYKVKLLTQKGIIGIEVNEGQNMEALNKEIVEKYGTFITLESEEIKNH